jgi:spore maturation protein CgeB
MSYRFIRVTSLYPAYISRFYNKQSAIDSLSYDEHYKSIITDSLELATSFGKHLRKTGVDAIEIISNDGILQKKWAKENSFNESTSNHEIILAQIKKYKPDVVWIDSTDLLNKNWINKLKSEVPSIKFLVAHICSPYNSIIGESFRHFDLVFTCSPCTLKELERGGVNAYLLYHSFDTNVLNLLKDNRNDFEENDFVFTGSLLTGYGLHKTRIEYLEEFLQNNIEIRIYGNIESQKTIRLKQTLHHTVKLMKRLGVEKVMGDHSFFKKYGKYADAQIVNYSSRLVNAVKPPVFGLDMYKVLQRSKLCFNIHGEIAQTCAGNIRLFEATGVGACLVTDWKENMKNIFDLDREVVTYRTTAECVDKVQWLLKNPLEMEKIASAGQNRTLSDHTVEKRVDIIHNIFQSRI